MDETPEEWATPVSPEQSNELDSDLIEELNKFDDTDIELDSTTEKHEKSNPCIFKLVGFVTIIGFLLVLFGNWLQLIKLPPLDFLARSSVLSENPKIQQLQKAVVMVYSGNSQGTGFNIDAHGLVVTNYHVIKDSARIKIVLAQGRVYIGRLLKGFPDLDLAVIKIDANSLPFLTLDYTALKTGDEVNIIGDPLGFTQVVMSGKVIDTTLLKGGKVPVLLIQAPIHRGNSGSPVFNKSGKVAAVVFAALNEPENKNSEVKGIAIPVIHLKQYLSTILK